VERIRALAAPSWPASTGAGLLVAAAAYASLTALLAPFFDAGDVLNVSLLYLLLTLVLSALWGYVVGCAGALVADLLVNFFFVRPVHTFTVQEPTNVLALVIFLAVAIVGASMLALLRRQVRVTEARRAETAAMLSVTQEVARAVSPRDAMDRICYSVVRSLRARACAIARQGAHWELVGSAGGLVALSRDEEALAAEAVRTGQIVRSGSVARARISRPGPGPARAHATLTIIPFGATAPERGVLLVSGAISPPPLTDGEQLLRAFADEASVAVHRATLANEASRVQALQRADEFKSVLLSSVSHDLRSPLTAIKAAVGSLRDSDVAWSDDDRATFLETIESQADRLTATVTNLLEMSRLEGGAVHPSLERVEALPLLEEVQAGTVQATAGRPVEIAAVPGLWLRADYGLLMQALTNLVENAAKYSRPGGAIRLSATAEGHRVRLACGDTGPGIPAEDLPHVFEKFYRGSDAAKSKGSGLGLAIAKAMVELCGGVIHVTSGPEGTVFTIDLARAEAPTV
jgi:two-component system sensor histidine kinase KdpD